MSISQCEPWNRNFGDGWGWRQRVVIAGCILTAKGASGRRIWGELDGKVERQVYGPHGLTDEEAVVGVRCDEIQERWRTGDGRALSVYAGFIKRMTPRKLDELLTPPLFHFLGTIAAFTQYFKKSTEWITARKPRYIFLNIRTFTLIQLIVILGRTVQVCPIRHGR